MTLPKDNYLTSTSLIDRVKDDDNEAWSELLFFYQRLLKYWISQHRIPEPDVEDVIQEVWCDVHDQIGRFFLRPGQRCMRPWLFQITTGKINDYLRRKKRKPTVQVHSSFFQNQEEKYREEEREKNLLLKSALEAIQKRVSQRDWGIFCQNVYTDRNAADIAEEYGVGKGNVRVIAHRITQKLKKEYEGLLD